MRLILIAAILLVLTGTNVLANELPLPRTVIALYDDKDNDISVSNIHKLVEMPLNHLGLNVEYYDVHKPLPDIAGRKDVLGVITWFYFNTKLDNPEEYLQWATKVADSGKKYVIVGAVGVMGGKAPHPSLTSVNNFVKKLGIKMTMGWTETAFDVTYDYKTPQMFLSQNTFDWIRPPYETVHVVDSSDVVHLSVHRGNDAEENSDLVVTGPNGGYVADGYTIRTSVRFGEFSRQWVINPFEFFRLALDTDRLPKPDTTTIAGRRIYYSHIDGDGLNSLTRLEEYSHKPVISGQVVMDKAVKPYPDLPVTLTVIAGDIDPKWAATSTSRSVVKEFFALPQVEAGSHTYSHPFNWQFFHDGDATKEIPYLNLYQQSAEQPVWDPKEVFSTLDSSSIKKLQAKPMPSGYPVPRAFAHEPFDINKEITGSLKAVGELVPENKKVEVLMWSGDCSPWEEAIKLTREAGVQNINGGDTIFDAKHPSYSAIAPIGRQVGKEKQIYASTSNEIPYTAEWIKDFHAYSYLVETLIRTETPVRLKPINIYYHLYSGEKEAGLTALLNNIKYANSQEIAPVTTSHYTHIAEGFYETQIVPLASDMWRIENRGALETIRFDHHTFKTVDFKRSKGVIGQKHLQGSLYVYLDSEVTQPVIAVKDNPTYFSHAEEDVPYLIDSRWLISNFRSENDQTDFTAQGFGAGEMVWQVPSDGLYSISINGNKLEDVNSEGRILKIKLMQDAIKPLHVSILRV